MNTIPPVKAKYARLDWRAWTSGAGAAAAVDQLLRVRSANTIEVAKVFIMAEGEDLCEGLCRGVVERSR